MEFVPILNTSTPYGEDVGVDSRRYGSAISPNSPICCLTTWLPVTRSLAVERVIGTVAVLMLSCRCGVQKHEL